ncbi:MAG: Tn3 family transposase [Methanosarcinales archaeon]|nr:Tn3 family transposase [Methanosarcinales archaeon]
MKPLRYKYTHEQLVSVVHFNEKDIETIKQCRSQYNHLGFAYQLAFVQLTNRFPKEQPFEVFDDILTFVSVQLNIPSKLIHTYEKRQPTINEHREKIRNYLGLQRFGEAELTKIEKFIFEEACRLEQTAALQVKTEQYLKEQGILNPSEDTLKRLIGKQREEAKRYIFRKISQGLSKELLEKLDTLLGDSQQSDLNFLKKPPGRPSPSALLDLIKKIDLIISTDILKIDLSWLNNNFQRSLTRYAEHQTTSKLRRLNPDQRYAILVCFLTQVHQDTVDQMVDMYDKLINRIYNHAQIDMDNNHKAQQKKIRESLSTFKDVAELILDDSVDDAVLRKELFQRIGKDKLTNQIEEVNVWLTGKYSHVFNIVKQRFSYIRQFSPAFIKHINLIPEGNENSTLFRSVDILQEMNDQNKRKLLEDVPLDFIHKKIRPFVEVNGNIDKAAWECALLIAIRDEIKAGNLSVKQSKCFGRFDDFFIPEKKWNELREAFFMRAKLPVRANEVEAFLTQRLNRAFDRFLELLPENSYVTMDENTWYLSADSIDKLDSESEKHLLLLKDWLSQHMREVKLPDLLIEVDNELKITRHFMSISQQENPSVGDICAILATILAHGCNIGPYTMSQITDGVSYNRIKHITDWMLTVEAQRVALAQVVNAISRLDITQAWGVGKTSSSDGQRFAFKRKVLQQTYSTKFNDFALEFYSFVADNYAPFYSIPIECTDRDAPYVLDGLLYNECDLPLEEHYTDTHGYTENNFAAFAMLGRSFSPRIRGLHKQRIYRIEKNKDYKALSPLVNRSDRTIHINWICDQWDRLGHFYASLESGHVTASTAMKRLNGYTVKNHFYRANRELGRIIKTEYILQYMSDKSLRQRTRRGLLKGEQIHALARDLNYGKRRRINSRDLQEQRNSCSCLNLILACIIYWQAKEINKVIMENYPENSSIDLSFMEHISPIAWDNVVLYGEYVLNPNLVKL